MYLFLFRVTTLAAILLVFACSPQQTSSVPKQDSFWHGIESCQELRVSVENSVCSTCHGPGRDSRAPDGKMVGTPKALTAWLFNSEHPGSVHLANLGISAPLWEEWVRDCPQHIRGGANP